MERESRSESATHLRDRLKEPKTNTLIIVDSMGLKFEFNLLEIP